MKEQMTESDAVNDEDVLMTEDHHQEDQDGVNFGDDDSSLLNENNLNGPVDDLTDTSDLPTSLIVTNLDTRIFSSGDLKVSCHDCFSDNIFPQLMLRIIYSESNDNKSIFWYMNWI